MKLKHMLVMATIVVATSFGMAIHVAKEQAKMDTPPLSGATHAKK